MCIELAELREPAKPGMPFLLPRKTSIPIFGPLRGLLKKLCLLKKPACLPARKEHLATPCPHIRPAGLPVPSAAPPHFHEVFLAGPQKAAAQSLAKAVAEVLFPVARDPAAMCLLTADLGISLCKFDYCYSGLMEYFSKLFIQNETPPTTEVLSRAA